MSELLPLGVDFYTLRIMNRVSNPPEVGDIFTTQSRGLTGVIKEVVPNRTGTYRIRYQHATLGDQWTTYDPLNPKGGVIAHANQEESA